MYAAGFISSLSTHFLRQGLSLNPELLDSGRLPALKSPLICVRLPAQCAQLFNQGAAEQAEVLTPWW